MDVLLALCLALMMSSCGGNAENHEEESTTAVYDDYASETPTPDYDYNATFDYYLVTGYYSADVSTQAEPTNHAAACGPTPALLLGLAVRLIWT